MRAAFLWRGWRYELPHILIATFVIYGFHARWWWKTTVCVCLEIAWLIARGILNRNDEQK